MGMFGSFLKKKLFSVLKNKENKKNTISFQFPFCFEKYKEHRKHKIQIKRRTGLENIEMVFFVFSISIFLRIVFKNMNQIGHMSLVVSVLKIFPFCSCFSLL